jgi:hypothetical protein
MNLMPEKNLKMFHPFCPFSSQLEGREEKLLGHFEN